MSTKSFSKIIAGTMTWGKWGKNYNSQQMAELINVCLENNIDTFDHADIYGDYSTEGEFGNAFIESKVDRNAIKLISKCGIQMISESRKNWIGHYNYSKEYIVAQAEQSLKNLKTDYLDLLLLHRPSPLMQADEIAEAITKLKNDGKILDFGVSNFTSSQCELIETKIKINYNQIKFSASHIEPMLDGSLDYMQIHAIKAMCWSPLGEVFKDESEQSLRLRKLASEMAVKYNCSEDVILIAWILKHPANILPVFGTATIDRIKNMAKATEINLELQDWFAFWVASTGQRVP